MALTKPRAYQLYDIDFKQAVLAVTSSNVTLVGGAPNQVDGVVLVAGSRVLVTAQTNAIQNGIYEVQILGTGSNGTWVRSQDAAVTGQLLPGTMITVTEGTINKDTQWLLTSDTVEINVSAINWEKISAKTFGAIDAGGTLIVPDNAGSILTLQNGNNIAITGNASTDTITISATFQTPQQIVNGSSNVNIPSPNGNVYVNIGGVSNVATFTNTGMVLNGSANILGSLAVSGLLSISRLSVGQLTVALNGNVNSNLSPSIDSTFSLGNATNKWKDLYLSNSTLWMEDVAISTNASDQMTVNGNVVLTTSSSGNINVLNPRILGNLTVDKTIYASNVIVSNGTANANVITDVIYVTDLNAVVSHVDWYYGDISNATGGYSNANVAAYLPTYGGQIGDGTGSINVSNLVVNNNFVVSSVVSTGDITAAGSLTGEDVTSNTTVSAGTSITAGTSVSAGTSLTAGTSVTAGTDINAGATITGEDIVSNATIVAGGSINSASSVTAQSVASNTSVAATTTVTAGTMINAGSTITGQALVSNTSVAASTSVTAGTTINAVGEITGQSVVSNTSVNAGSTINAVGAITGQSLVSNSTVTAATTISGLDINSGNTINAVGTITGNNIVANGFLLVDSINVANDVSIGGNLLISKDLDVGNIGALESLISLGNFYADGANAYINSAEVQIAGPTFGIGRDANNTPLTSNDSKDRGEQLWYYDVPANAEKSAFIGYDAATSKLFAAIDVTNTNHLVTVNNYGNIVFGNVEASDFVASNLVTSVNILATANVDTSNLNVANNVAVAGNVNISGNLFINEIVSNTVTANLITTVDANITNDLLVNGNEVVLGNLQVEDTFIANGANTYINSARVAIADPIVSVGRNANDVPLTSTDSRERGTQMYYWDVGNAIERSAFVGFDTGNTQIIAAVQANIANDFVTVSRWGTFRTGNVVAESAVLSSGFTAANIISNSNITAVGLTLSGTANIAGDANVAGDISGNNLALVGGATVGTDLAVTGNISVSAVSASGDVTATGNVAATNLNLTKDVFAANARLTGTLNTAGKITAGNILSNTGLTSQTLKVTADADIIGNLIVSSNLIVQGNTTYINVVDYAVEDPIISLGGNANAPLSFNDGLARGTNLIYYGNGAQRSAFMGFDNGNGVMTIAQNVVITGELVNVQNYGTFVTGNMVGNSVTVDGDISANDLALSGNANVTANLNVSGWINASHVNFSGNFIANSVASNTYVNAAANVVGANVVANAGVFGTTVTATSAITAPTITATSNLVSSNTIFGTTVYASGNLSAAAANVTGVVSAGNFATPGNLIALTGKVATNYLEVATNANIAGSANVVGDLSAATLHIDTTANIGGDANVVGDLSVNNIAAAGNLSVTNISSTGNATLTGNVSAQNATLSAALTAAGKITAANILSNTFVTAANLVTTGSAAIGGDISIAGNLLVDGTVVTLNVGTLAIEDPLISIGRGANNAPLTSNDGRDRGEAFYYFSGGEKIAFVGYDQSACSMMVAQSVTIAADNVSTVSNWGNFRTGNVIANGYVTSSGNLTVANANLGDIASANFFVGDAGYLSNIPLGNIAFNDVIPTANLVYTLGNATNQWKEIWVGGNTIYIDSIPLAVDANNELTFNGDTVVTANTSNVVNIDDLNVTHTLYADNVIATTQTTTAVLTATTSANVQALSVVGIANIGSHANVVGNVSANNVLATANVQGGNIKTANAVLAGTVNATANVTAANLVANSGVYATNLILSGTANIAGSANVVSELSAATLRVSSTANIGGAANVVGAISGGSLAISGVANVTGALTGGASAAFTGNVTGGNLITANAIFAGGNITGANIVANSTIVGNSLIVNGTAQVTANLIIGENLIVQGNTTYVNVTEYYVEDPIISVGVGANGAPLTLNDGKDRGMDMVYFSGSQKIAFMGFDNTDSKMIIAQEVTNANEIITVTSWGTLAAGNIQANSLALAGNGNISANNITLSGLANVAGNLYVTGTLSANDVSFSGNIDVQNINATGNIVGAAITSNSNVTAVGLSLSGNSVVSGTSVVTGNASAANFNTTGRVTATGNVTGGNLVTANGVFATNLTLTNNATIAGAIDLAGAITAANIISNSNVTATNLTLSSNANISGVATVTGNVTAGNLKTAAGVFAKDAALTGNLTASGNATVTGNILAGNVTATANVTATDLVATSNVYSNNMSLLGTANIAGNANVLGRASSQTLLVDSTANILGAANIVGAISGGSTLTIAGLANIAGNIVSASNLVLGKDVFANNAYLNNFLYANANVTAGNLTSNADITGVDMTLTGNAEIVGNLVINENLTVHGNTVYVNVIDYYVQDPIISMGGNANGAPLTSNDGLDRGTNLIYYSGAQKSAFMGYDNSAAKMFVAQDVSIANEIVTVNNWGTFVTGNIQANSLALSGNGNISAGNATITGNSVLGDVLVTGYLNAANLLLTGDINVANITAGGNITGNMNLILGDDIYANNAYLSNFVYAGANVTAGNLVANSQVVTATATITGNATANNLTVSNFGQFNILSVGMAAPAGNTSGDLFVANEMYAYGTSDIKFKTNVVAITNALDAVANIGGHTFDWSEEYLFAHGGEDGFFINKHDFGVIAQDVQKEFPLAVRTRQDGSLAVDYNKLSALAMAAIKELKAKAEEQAQTISDILSRLDKLENK